MMPTIASERAVLAQCTELLRGMLPKDWEVRSETPTGPSIPKSLDGQLRIAPPDGDAANFLIEVKRVLNRRDTDAVARRLKEATADASTQGMVMAGYISPPLQEVLQGLGLSYVDTTGNAMVTAKRPALVLRDRGSSRNPFRDRGRPRASLGGEPAAKVVRTLVGERGPWTAREITTRSDVSTGATYRVFEYLQEEDLVTRTADKRFEVTDWTQLLRRWSRDYSFVDNSRVGRFIEPRGVPSVMKRLANERDPGFRYAVTGSVAAAEWAPYAPARAVFIYAEDAYRAAREWRLHPADADTEQAANVIIGEPEYPVVFDNTSCSEGGYTIAAIEQVAVDLLSGPGRNPAEGEELVRWMQAHESAWRR